MYIFISIYLYIYCLIDWIFGFDIFFWIFRFFSFFVGKGSFRCFVIIRFVEAIIVIYYVIFILKMEGWKINGEKMYLMLIVRDSVFYYCRFFIF